MKPIEHKFKEVNRAARNCRRRSPPRPSVPAMSDQLWNLIPHEQRQRTLATLGGVLLRQLDGPRDGEGVRDEGS